MSLSKEQIVDSLNYQEGQNGDLGSKYAMTMANRNPIATFNVHSSSILATGDMRGLVPLGLDEEGK